MKEIFHIMLDDKGRAGVDTACIDKLSTETISRHVDKQHRISTNKYKKYNTINGHVELQADSIYDQFFLS